MGSAVNADLSVNQETPAKETGGYAKFKLVVSHDWTAPTTKIPSARLQKILDAHPLLTEILHDDHCELGAGGALMSYGENRTFMTPKTGARFARNEQVIPAFLPSFHGVLVPTYAALPTPFVPILAFFLTHVRPLFLHSCAPLRLPSLRHSLRFPFLPFHPSLQVFAKYDVTRTGKALNVHLLKEVAELGTKYAIAPY